MYISQERSPWLQDLFESWRTNLPVETLGVLLHMLQNLLRQALNCLMVLALLDATLCIVQMTARLQTKAKYGHTNTKLKSCTGFRLNKEHAWVSTGP